MDDLTTDAIRARADAATPGPWNTGRKRRDAQHNTNLTFIAHARTDVPELCDELDKVRAELAEARGQLARARKIIDESPTLTYWDALQSDLRGALRKLAKVRALLSSEDDPYVHEGYHHNDDDRPMINQEEK